MRQNLSGISEFWECMKTRTPEQIGECAGLLWGKNLEIDITKSPKVPVEIKPDWVWFAAGFLTAWILKK